MLEEAIQVIRALERPGKVSFTGRHYRLQDVEMHPKPAQTPLPLLIGGAGERRTLRLVAQHAQEWNLPGATPERVREKTAVLERHCEREGRDPASIERSVMAAFIIGEDDAAISRRLRALQEILPLPRSSSDAELLQGMRGRGWLIGRPAEVVEQLGALAQAGVSRVMLQHHNQEDLEVLELIAREVMPAVAGA